MSYLLLTKKTNHLVSINASWTNHSKIKIENFDFFLPLAKYRDSGNLMGLNVQQLKVESVTELTL